MSSPSPEPVPLPPGYHPNGLVTVASLHLAAFLSAGFGPGGPPPGLLDRLTYSVHGERVHVTIPPDEARDMALMTRLTGWEYEDQPIVGWKDGIATRPDDYITWGSSSHPFVPGDHPIEEAETDGRLVGTNWLSKAESAERGLADWGGGEVERVDAQPLPAGYRWPSDESLPLEGSGCDCTDCRGAGAEEDRLGGRAAGADGA